MKREFLEGLNLDKDTIDKILAENGADIEREKGKTTQAKADLADAQAKLAEHVKDLEEMKKNSGDATAIQKRLDELQSKYDAETEQYKAQLAQRDYADAMTASIAAKGLKFSSRGAEKAFREELKVKSLTVKDGVLEGFDEFVKAQQEADPGAFAPEKPPAAIVGKVGVGGAPAGNEEPENVALARKMGENRAAALKASKEAINKFF